jgi:hypothetical protein
MARVRELAQKGQTTLFVNFVGVDFSTEEDANKGIKYLESKGVGCWRHKRTTHVEIHCLPKDIIEGIET